MRMFSVPYNLSQASSFIQSMEVYKEHIDHFYFGIPSLDGSHQDFRMRNNISNMEVLEQEKNVYDFLALTQGTYRRFLTLNLPYFNLTPNDKNLLVVSRLVPLVKQFDIEGIICSDYYMMQMLHTCLPEVELCTSCNSWIWTTREMDYFAKAGATMFNPPREAIKMPKKLKEFKATGYKLKYLINEACIFGCPTTITHCMDRVMNNYHKETTACQICNVKEQMLRSNAILPRWLPFLDEYVDIYKLTGRNRSTQFIVNSLHAYIYELDDINLWHITSGGSLHALEFGTMIPTRDIPNKLLTCECKDCNNCHLCDMVVNKYEKQYLEQRENNNDCIVL